MSFPVDPSGTGINVDPHQILDSLKFKSGRALQELNFNGAMLGVTFRW
jgi:hypothetical protein